jgi:[ribosomal protein S18]-alanine N-acetyltransferase
MTLSIRTLRPHDGQTAAILHARCFAELGERAWSADEFTGLLATPGCLGLLLIADQQPHGFAVARVAADEAEVLTLGVVPAARRRGGGSRLLSSLERRCRRRGARSLFLDVAEDNVPARRLYAARGFTVVGRREAYFDRKHGSAAALVMRLDFHNVAER